MTKVEQRKIAELRPDPSNANKGTERGLRVLDDSISEAGLGRSIVVDKNGLIVAGNKTAERAVDWGFEDAVVVHTTGDKLVVVQRDDLDLTDEQLEAALDYIAEHHAEFEAEYARVVREAEENRRYWEEKTREREALIAQLPSRTDYPEARAKLAAMRAKRNGS